ncbi:MAG: glucosamine-6-phosphate deaminase [Candidatus Bipolaricaulota bacterium]|nr:glucosamine-6-phosphate deaminase [Candidatus Bipolaricaulota bacterium]
MKIIVEPRYEEVSKSAARIIAREIISKTDPVLGLPTGDTPKRTYELLVEYYRDGLVDFSSVTTFNLDEYYPISKDDPKSFARYMEDRLFTQVNLARDSINFPDSTIAENEIEQYCEKYERKISEAGGIDLLILGIGQNGHIGFNEPGVNFGTRTRLVDLRKETLEANFENPAEAPKRALTMGIKSIMRARKLLLLANGKRKSTPIKKSLTGPITTDWPASVLQLHPDLTVILDEDASRELEDQRGGSAGN